MWEEHIPEKKIGTLAPLSAVENSAYEFYRIAPKDVMCIYLPVGLKKFKAEDVDRVFEPIDKLIEALVDRDVDIIVQSGVPLPILIGVEAHNRLMDHIAIKSGLPVTSSVTAVVDAARHLGIRNITLANKWSPEMNGVMGEFFGRGGIKVAGICSDSMTPDKFLKMSTKNGMDLAYELGSRAIRENPGCDGLYIGGGAWLALPVCEELEKEFGLPCISNQDSVLWDCLHKINYWRPTTISNRLMAGD
jgi:maleate cis-trans isomerase